MKKRFDINEIYEMLTDAVREGDISHNDVFSMIDDFCQDTLMIKTELELDQKTIDDLENIRKALVIAMRNKNLNKL